MERKKYIIVGGVAGGASFACRLRRLDENADIVIYEKSNFVSYANCGLPYYLSKTIANPSSLTLQTPQSLKARFNIDVHVNSEVIGIDREKHLVTVKSLVDGTVKTDCYDKLILSPGAESIKLTENAENVFELKTVEDSLRLRRYIEEKNPRKAAVIGGGFIGVEAAENLVESGLEVTLIEGKDHVLANFDSDMASFIHEALLSIMRSSSPRRVWRRSSTLPSMRAYMAGTSATGSDSSPASGRYLPLTSCSRRRLEASRCACRWSICTESSAMRAVAACFSASSLNCGRRLCCGKNIPRLPSPLWERCAIRP